MKKVYIIALLIALCVIGNCSTAYTPPTASLFQSVTLNKDISSGTEIGSKSGEACTHNILYLLSFGDAGIGQAAAKGSIKVVKAVDYSNMSVFGSLYARVCTIARGD